VAAVAAGWLIPGAGHFLQGRRGKAAFYFLLVLGTFALGLVLAEFHAVRLDRHPIYFLAYVFNLLPTVVAALATSSLRVDHFVVYENLGTLYCAVASLLNFLVILDILGGRSVPVASPTAAGNRAEEGGAA